MQTIEVNVEPEGLFLNQDQKRGLISEWERADQNQREWRAREIELRARVVSLLFDSSKQSGVEHLELANGWKLSATKKLDYKLNNKNNELDEALKGFDDALAELLVKWEPKLSVSNYQALTPALQSKLSGCLTIKPAMPSLEMVGPKK